MKYRYGFAWLAIGLIVGGLGMKYGAAGPPVLAFNDRADECIICTGPVLMDAFKDTVDGIWLLDYRAGILRGTVVDQRNGRVLPWYEVDLVKEFGIAPKQNVHFLMTSGTNAKGHTSLYVAETVSGKFGLYGMFPRRVPGWGVEIRRMDFTNFRTRTSVN